MTLAAIVLLAGCSTATRGQGVRASLPPATHAQLVALLPTRTGLPPGWKTSTYAADSIDDDDTDLATCVGQLDVVPERVNEAAGNSIYLDDLGFEAWAYSYNSHEAVTGDLAVVRSPKFAGCTRQAFLDDSDYGATPDVTATVTTGRAGVSKTTVVGVDVTVKYTDDDNAQHVEYDIYAYVFGQKVDGEIDFGNLDAQIPVTLPANQIAAFADRIALAG
jgi:hypothetical protein